MTSRPQRLLITGSNGSIGTMLRSRLARPGRVLRLLDREPPAAGPADAGTVEAVHASVTDLAAMTDACDGVDAVVHLGGLSGEAPWPDILHTNVHGSYCVLEAARRRGVDRVVLASSNHAAGHWTRADAPAEGLPAGLPPRPDSYYGWSKASVEALGRLYADAHGMDVLCLRIGACYERPRSLRELAVWLSPDDAARLVEACLDAPAPGYRLLWGISRNTRRWWSLAEGERLGYRPQDDAEVYAASVPAAGGGPGADEQALHTVGGGVFSPGVFPGAESTTDKD